MLIPVIEKILSKKSPWEVYRSVYGASRVSFFLDSHAHLPPAQAYSYIGRDPFMEVTVRNGRTRVRRGGKESVFSARDLLRVLRSEFQKLRVAPGVRRKPFFMGGAVGFWGYPLAALFETVRLAKKRPGETPDLYLGFYRELIVYDHARRLYWLVTHVNGRKNETGRHLRRRAQSGLAGLRTLLEAPLAEPRRFALNRFRAETSRKDFENRVRRAKEYIAAGDIYQANLSQRLSFEFRGDPLKIYGALREINPSPFASFLKIDGLHIVSSSPERLVRKRGREVETNPIAGTRPRTLIRGRENDLSGELLSNAKERAEHIMLVDLERNDLGRVCDWRTVRVREMMKIEKYSHVIHLVSKITGRMQKGRDVFDLIRAMFPGGTITGCPKIRCMQIIDELEKKNRGIYTGSIGYLDFFGDADLNIVIRTLVLQDGRLSGKRRLRTGRGFLQVGAGIVHDSDPAREYEETHHKGEALVEALARASD